MYGIDINDFPNTPFLDKVEKQWETIESKYPNDSEHVVSLMKQLVVDLKIVDAIDLPTVYSEVYWIANGVTSWGIEKIS